MNKGLILIILALIGAGDLLKGQADEKITFVFPVEQRIESNSLEALKYDLITSQLADSVELLGEKVPIIVIKPNQDNLLRNNINRQDIFNILKKELNIPIWEDTEENAFFCRLKDYRAFDETRKIDALGLIRFKCVGLNRYVSLMQIANIYLKLKTDGVLYQDKKVYFISFIFRGKLESDFQQLLKLVDNYQLKYKVVRELLSEVQD
jgi:hypothetical protein